MSMPSSFFLSASMTTIENTTVMRKEMTKLGGWISRPNITTSTYTLEAWIRLRASEPGRSDAYIVSQFDTDVYGPT